MDWQRVIIRASSDKREFLLRRPIIRDKKVSAIAPLRAIIVFFVALIIETNLNFLEVESAASRFVLEN